MQELEQRRAQASSRPTTASTERPVTAPASNGGAAPAKQAAAPALAPGPVTVERSVSVPGASTTVECQPNPLAPLLRDEKARREWVEHELDACCAAYDLQASWRAGGGYACNVLHADGWMHALLVGEDVCLEGTAI